MRRNKSRVPLPIATATIDNLSHDGKGIARINGKTTFISGALPGEVVEFQYSRIKKDFDEGRITAVITPSSLRVPPKCPHYTHCGACAMQHVRKRSKLVSSRNIY